MKKSLTTLALVSLLAITGCGEKAADSEEAPKENTAVVNPGHGEKVTVPIKIGEPTRIENTEGEELLSFEVAKVEKSVTCTPLVRGAKRPVGVPTRVTFNIAQSDAYKELNPKFVYNHLGWEFIYSDGSENAKMLWATVRCQEANEDTKDNMQPINDGKATLLIPNADGKLVYNDYLTGAQFELPTEKTN